jgi:hypothetical protein
MTKTISLPRSVIGKKEGYSTTVRLDRFNTVVIKYQISQVLYTIALKILRKSRVYRYHSRHSTITSLVTY